MAKDKVTRYMLRMDDNKVYVYHPITVTLKNFVEITPQQAANIRNRKPLMDGLTFDDVSKVVPNQGQVLGNSAQTAEQLAELTYVKKKLAVALELLGLSNPAELPDDLTEGRVIMDEMEIPPAPEGEADAAAEETETEERDPDIAMLEDILDAGKGKAQVESYILRSYGIAVDPKSKLKDLVAMGIELREKAMEEERNTPTQDADMGVPVAE